MATYEKGSPEDVWDLKGTILNIANNVTSHRFDKDFDTLYTNDSQQTLMVIVSIDFSSPSGGWAYAETSVSLPEDPSIPTIAYGLNGIIDTQSYLDISNQIVIIVQKGCKYIIQKHEGGGGSCILDSWWEILI